MQITLGRRCFTERFTKETGGAHFVDEEMITREEAGYTGAAIERLAKFENLCGRLEEEQLDIAEHMKALRNKGKTRSAEFKQLLSKKLMNQQILIMIEAMGIKVEA